MSWLSCLVWACGITILLCALIVIVDSYRLDARAKRIRDRDAKRHSPGCFKVGGSVR
jgi:hypothetical protein